MDILRPGFERSTISGWNKMFVLMDKAPAPALPAKLPKPKAKLKMRKKAK
jgi:hypothetical protein